MSVECVKASPSITTLRRRQRVKIIFSTIIVSNIKTQQSYQEPRKVEADVEIFKSSTSAEGFILKRDGSGETH